MEYETVEAKVPKIEESSGIARSMNFEDLLVSEFSSGKVRLIRNGIFATGAL